MTEEWTDEELLAAISAYQEMAELELKQKPYSKRDVYRKLAKRYGRTEKSYEYRMQNISAILNELGMSWIPGLKPAGNVGANVKTRIVTLMKASSTSHTAPSKYKLKLPAMRDWLIAIARNEGKVTYKQVMDAFRLDRFSLRHAMDLLGHQAKKLNEPIITALIVSSKTGRCSAGLAKEFGVLDDVTERQKLYNFWMSKPFAPAPALSESEDMEVRAARFVSAEARPDQAAFRSKLFFAYDGKCVISGCSVGATLDAAHRHGRDWRLGHNRAEDGYLLRKDLHALYDNDLLSITPEGKVQLHPMVVKDYAEYEGITVGTQKELA